VDSSSTRNPFRSRRATAPASTTTAVPNTWTWARATPASRWGHRHDAVDAAAKNQIDKLTYVQASYPNSARTELYETLAETAPDPIDKVWLCNSGTEANEAALKFARSATGNSKIIAAMQSFHGRTMGSLAATWKSKYKGALRAAGGEFEFVPYDDPEAMREAVDDETAAVIVEPVQGEGGINPASAEYLEAAREATEEAGAALVFDEVQTGMGRTGSLWACEQTGVVPDMITSAKGLANGFPMGATLCRDWIAEEYGSHASTFSGGPVVSAAANATVQTIVEEDVPAHARIGRQLPAGAPGGRTRRRRPRGPRRGLMVGVEVKRGRCATSNSSR